MRGESGRRADLRIPPSKHHQCPGIPRIKKSSKHGWQIEYKSQIQNQILSSIEYGQELCEAVEGCEIGIVFRGGKVVQLEEFEPQGG